MGRRGRNSLIKEEFFFVTTTVIDFLPIFSNAKFCDILISNIRHYQSQYKFEILAYVIMPSHFHWIVKVNSEYGTISYVMRDIKKFTAWQIFDLLPDGSDLIFIKAAKHLPGQDRKFWMERFDDEVIRNDRMFWDKVKYIHNNPVEADIVIKPEDYKYSSARNYVLNDHSLLKVNTEMGGIPMY